MYVYAQNMLHVVNDIVNNGKQTKKTKRSDYLTRISFYLSIHKYFDFGLPLKNEREKRKII